MKIEIYNFKEGKFRTKETNDYDFDLIADLIFAADIFRFPTEEDAKTANLLCEENWESINGCQYYDTEQPIFKSQTIYYLENYDRVEPMEDIIKSLEKRLELFKKINS